MSRKRWLQREKMRAVHDNDLEQFLSSIGVLDQIKNGNYHCSACDTEITMENLGAIYPKDNKINFVCNRPCCLTEIETTKEDINE